jgi:AcrR family transcriptional regulator
MQIKKEEIRDQIVLAAEKEFLKRGYRNSSMRTIAVKSHTTLGNLYNYFENKEAILDAVIGDTPEKIRQILQEHESATASTFKVSKDYLEDNFDQFANTEMPQLFPLEILLSTPLVILIEGCEGTKYELYRDQFIDQFQKHIANHLNVEPDSFIAKSLVHGFISSLLFISKNKKNVEEGKKDLMAYIRTMTLGMPMPK